MDYKSKEAQDLIERATDRIELARKYENQFPDAYERFFLGKKTFAILTVDPTTGRPRHNTWPVMQATYDDYRKNPDKRIDLKLSEVLHDTLKNETISAYLRSAIEELMFQMHCEKDGFAPFKLDCLNMLHELKDNIIRNKDKFELNDMMKEIEGYNATLKEHYNQNIL